VEGLHHGASCAIAGGTYGTIRTTYLARQVQLALKLYF
jgi:hypothetical protein